MNPGFFSSRENEGLDIAHRLTAEGTTIPAGAILFDDGWILSTSGYSPADDECVGLATRVLAGHTSLEESKMIAQALGNSRYEQIVDDLLST